MSKSDYLESGLLNYLYRNQALTQPATTYVSLHTADPTDLGTGTEVSGGSYARVGVTSDTSSWSAPADDGAGGSEITNAVAITFPNPTADWGTITHFAIWTASSAGNMLHAGSFQTPRAIASGDVAPQFAVGALRISES